MSQQDKPSDRPAAKPKDGVGRDDRTNYVIVPRNGNVLSRAYAIVKSSFLHPFSTTVIREHDDKVEAHP